MILTIILVVVIVALAIALFIQIKRLKEQKEAGEELLKSYQRRVDEQQRVLDDYKNLEKNFNSVGMGYEQALLAFDKMEEEKQKQQGRIQTISDEIKKLIDTSSQQGARIAQLLDRLIEKQA